MTNDERDKIRIKIEDDLVVFERQIEVLESKTKPISPDCSLGRLTRVEAMNEQVINLKILDETRIRETRLVNALRRVEHEMFGICIECEESIGIGRMLIRPESVRCVECAD